MWIIITLLVIALVAVIDFIKKSKKTEHNKVLNRQMDILKEIYLKK